MLLKILGEQSLNLHVELDFFSTLEGRVVDMLDQFPSKVLRQNHLLSSVNHQSPGL